MPFSHSPSLAATQTSPPPQGAYSSSLLSLPLQSFSSLAESLDRI